MVKLCKVAGSSILSLKCLKISCFLDRLAMLVTHMSSRHNYCISLFQHPKSWKPDSAIWDFPKIRVPYFGVLIIRILLFRVLY